jgi:hypothetical protein
LRGKLWVKGSLHLGESTVPLGWRLSFIPDKALIHRSAIMAVEVLAAPLAWRASQRRLRR